MFENDFVLKKVINAKNNNGKCEDRIICGWKFEARQYFNFEFNYESKIKIKCDKCNNLIIFSSQYGECCSKCYEYYENELYDELEFRARNFDFILEETKEIGLFNSVYKIKIDFNNVVYFGILKCAISYEENEWSSSPHDDYFAEYYLFDSEENRNKIYDEI